MGKKKNFKTAEENKFLSGDSKLASMAWDSLRLGGVMTSAMWMVRIKMKMDGSRSCSVACSWRGPYLPVN